ncbi:MAG: ATPase, T2SS/T4P/T4SS family [Gallionella sp.]|nr:ATPase, T2SS/T4P/T4SS family [Gallionella sp.]
MEALKAKYPKLTQAFDQAGLPFPKFLLEKYERILQKIELSWDSQDADKYLDSLLLKDRDDRQGFSFEAISEIDLVKRIHDYLIPSSKIDLYDPFGAGVVSPRDEMLAYCPSCDQKNTSDTTQIPIPVTVDEPPEKTVEKHINWPRVHTQRELIEYAELKSKQGRLIYEQQGKSLGEILKYYKIIDERDINLTKSLRNLPQNAKLPVGQMLVESGMISSEELVCALCIQAGIIMVDIVMMPIDFQTAKILPIDIARVKQVFPAGVYQHTLFLAVSDPFSFNEASYFTILTGLKIELVYAPRHEIVNRINLTGSPRSTIESQKEFRNMAMTALDLSGGKPPVDEVVKDDISENDSGIINLVNQIIRHGIEQGASDIHIELFQGSEESCIRFRRDGRMEHFSTFPAAYHRAVISRIKIMANLDISEKRLPQDGKISFALPEGKRIDLRVATLPSLHGIEFVTIRILAAGEPLPLDTLGMAERDMNVFREISQRPYGLILVCGPTGSGKTTTLHSVLKQLNTDDRKIWTAEDPVEIVQPHLCQVQINKKIGLSFAEILRSFLRADPDVIMIGEMRDQETAKIALEASMTGHLVLSTLHTNSASETVARLIDLGIDRYNLSDALLAILAQRLARKLCAACSWPEEISAQALDEVANEYVLSVQTKLPSRQEREDLVERWRGAYAQDGKLYFRNPAGCKLCNGGYKGRVGLYELLRATPALRHQVRQHSSASEYLKAGVEDGMRTLKQDGIEKVLRGITDMSQIRSACV